MNIRLLAVGLLVALAAALALLACSTGDDSSDRSGGDDDTGGLLPSDDDNGGTDDDDDDDDDDDAGDDDSDDDDDDDDSVNEACDGDATPHELRYTKWAQVPDVLKTALYDVFQDTSVCEDFYGRFISWYGILRECSRALRDYYNPDYPGSRWDEEVLAAQIAVAYIDARGENLNAAFLSQEIDQLYAALESPVPAIGQPEPYFKNHEAQILADPQAFFWYQVHWAKMAFDDENLNDFSFMLSGHVCFKVDTTVEFDPGLPFTNFTDPNLPINVFEIYNLELATWRLRFNPELVLVNKPTTGLAMYE